MDGEITLPNSINGFWMHGSSWEFPTLDNGDVFANRIVRAQLVHHDPVVSDAYAHAGSGLTTRLIQRRFLAVAGLSRTALWQIERARAAAQLLQQGASIADVTFQLGYFDQAHLTRLVRRLIGQTPAQLQSATRRMPLSIL